MTKKELQLIKAHLDVKHSKRELQCAYFGDNGIYATDGLTALYFNIPLLGGDFYLHGQLLQGFIASMSKNDVAEILSGQTLMCDDICLDCDSFTSDGEFKDKYKRLFFNYEYDVTFKLDSLSNIVFELHSRECFINPDRFNGLLKYVECGRYVISYSKQTKKLSRVQIVGLYNTKEETDLIKFTFTTVGNVFTSSAS